MSDRNAVSDGTGAGAGIPLCLSRSIRKNAVSFGASSSNVSSGKIFFGFSFFDLDFAVESGGGSAGRGLAKIEETISEIGGFTSFGFTTILKEIFDSSIT
jgi:hypothetical protein